MQLQQRSLNTRPLLPSLVPVFIKPLSSPNTSSTDSKTDTGLFSLFFLLLLLTDSAASKHPDNSCHTDVTVKKNRSALQVMKQSLVRSGKIFFSSSWGVLRRGVCAKDSPKTGIDSSSLAPVDTRYERAFVEKSSGTCCHC